jgi:hypothetical protein
MKTRVWRDGTGGSPCRGDAYKVATSFAVTFSAEGRQNAPLGLKNCRALKTAVFRRGRRASPVQAHAAGDSRRMSDELPGADESDAQEGLRTSPVGAHAAKNRRRMPDE